MMRMDLPGIRVKPIITLAGDHEVNQVFSTMCVFLLPTVWAQRTRVGPLQNTCSNTNVAVAVFLPD